MDSTAPELWCHDSSAVSGQKLSLICNGNINMCSLFTKLMSVHEIQRISTETSRAFTDISTCIPWQNEPRRLFQNSRKMVGANLAHYMHKRWCDPPGKASLYFLNTKGFEFTHLDLHTMFKDTFFVYTKKNPKKTLNTQRFFNWLASVHILRSANRPATIESITCSSNQSMPHIHLQHT